MKLRFVLICFLASLQPLWAQQTAPLPSVTLPPEMDRVLRDYERAWKAKDTEALVALFTPDGFVMQPQRPPVQGHDGLRNAYRGSGGTLFLRALSFAQSESVGYIIGAYRYTTEPGDVGKFVLTLRRSTGQRWLIAADMDNSINKP